ncbi:unnamed protein product [Staurois parvus]|uniref:Uncharacterized protein n=1 Tax=Staurois parvus TaxID=386267 RepID=A0ABN9CCL0_9NEOB|nr:unnamed protein product [Staurois parvus]
MGLWIKPKGDAIMKSHVCRKRGLNMRPVNASITLK